MHPPSPFQILSGFVTPSTDGGVVHLDLDVSTSRCVASGRSTTAGIDDGRGCSSFPFASNCNVLCSPEYNRGQSSLSLSVCGLAGGKSVGVSSVLRISATVSCFESLGVGEPRSEVGCGDTSNEWAVMAVSVRGRVESRLASWLDTVSMKTEEITQLSLSTSSRSL